jgi:phenylpropionate dioxygenase-like ring-hydroxylating dioxygenase large terminal subunit
MTTPSWDSSFELREDGIPKARYTSPDFARLEAERLWSRCWQMACRSEEIPEPGDYTVYDIVDQSLIVVRQDDGSVAAYHNVCPHRATQLAVGSGSFASRRIVCPFHGWAWRCDGRNAFVLDPGEFCGGKPNAEDVDLRRVQVAEWLGCVFVNFDPKAPPFEQQIASIRDYLEPLNIAEMRVYWWVRARIPANWKVAQEAFLEAYHTPGAHPQLAQFTTSGEMVHRGIRYEIFDGGHSAFRMGPGTREDARPLTLEELTEQLGKLQEGLDAMVLARDMEILRDLAKQGLPTGMSAPAAFMTELYARASREGRKLPKPDPDVLQRWGGESFLFPNFFFLPQFGNSLSYRARPDGFDPDSCIFEVWSLTLPAKGEPARRPTCVDVAHDDEEQLGLIPRQDFANIPRIQRGLHSVGFEATRLASYQERSILHYHRELDRYLTRA